MKRHSPGPWEAVDNTGNGYGYELVDSYRRQIAIIPSYKRDMELKRANANLIEAAPELLKACEMALRIIWDSNRLLGGREFQTDERTGKRTRQERYFVHESTVLENIIKKARGDK